MAEQASWYVVHTYSGYENKVAQDLMTMVENRRIQDLICDVKVPRKRLSRKSLTSAATRPAKKRCSASCIPVMFSSKWS